MISEIKHSLTMIAKRSGQAVRGFFGSRRDSAKRAHANLALRQVMSARGGKLLPSGSQLKHLPQLLTSSEKKIAIAALATAIITGALLVWQLAYTQRAVQPAVGGTYTEGLIGSPQLINPIYALTSDVDTDLTRLIYSGLMRYDMQNGLTYDLADSVEVSEDQMQYTFHLREDAYWHDGRQVKAADVVFTISAIQNVEYRSPLEISFSGVKVEQVDEFAVRFTLNEPFAPFLSLMTVGILPSHLWENVSPHAAAVAELNTMPIGSGPYQFDKLVKDNNGQIRSYTLVRNAGYYRGAPYIEELTFKFYGDIFSAQEALRNRNIEGLSYLPFDAVVDFENNNNLQILFPTLSQYTAAFFNQEHQSILEDDAVREALVLATNKDQIVEAVLGGFGQSIDSFILDGMIGEHDELATFAFDINAANQKLEEAGWTLAEGASVRQKDDQELKLNIVTLDSAELTATAEELSSMWALAGVQVSISAVDNTTFQNEVLKNRDYDILISGELYSIDPDPYAFWHSSQTEFPGLNLSGFSNRQADELIEQARATTDTQIRAEAYRELQDLIAENLPAIFLFQPTYSYVTAEKINNIEVSNIVIPADRFANINTWYIKTKKSRVRKSEVVEEVSEEDEEVTADVEEVIQEDEEVTAGAEEVIGEVGDEAATEETTEDSESETVDSSD